MCTSPRRLVAYLSAGALALGACIIHIARQGSRRPVAAAVAEGPPLRAARAPNKRYVGTAIMSDRLASATGRN